MGVELLLYLTSHSWSVSFSLSSRNNWFSENLCEERESTEGRHLNTGKNVSNGSDLRLNRIDVCIFYFYLIHRAYDDIFVY